MVIETRVSQTPTEKAPEPALGTELIPKERYTSAEFMRLEWERLWTKVWNIAGRESDIPNVGDYFTTELGPESFLVVRETPDRVRAFYNVCPHRGNQIRNPGMGHASPSSAPTTSSSSTSTAPRSSCRTRTRSRRGCRRRRRWWRCPATRGAAGCGST